MPKGPWPILEIKDSSTEVLNKALAQLVLDTNTALRTEANINIEKRLNALEYTTERLKIDTQDNLQKKLERKTKELAALKAEILHKIKILETESRLNHEIELAKLEEAKNLDRLTLERRVAELRADLESTRKDLIATYEMAIQTATKLGLENPLPTTSFSGSGQGLVTFPVPQESLYLRGAKALSLELEYIRSPKSDALLAPKLKSAENKLRLYKEKPEYIVAATARTHPEDFNPKIPPLKSQLQGLDKDPELLTLKKLAQEKNGAASENHVGLKLIEQEKARLSRLLPSLDSLELVKVAGYQLETKTLSKKWLAILIAAFMGLFGGTLFACLKDSWSRRMASLQAPQSHSSAFYKN